MKTFIEWMDGKNGYTFRGNMKEKDDAYIQSEVEKYADSELNLCAIPDVSKRSELLIGFVMDLKFANIITPTEMYELARRIEKANL